MLPGFPCRQGWPITQAMNASSSPRHFIAANNMFDAQYINYYTGLSPVLLVRGSFPLPPPVSTQTLQFMNFSKQSKIPLNGLFLLFSESVHTHQHVFFCILFTIQHGSHQLVLPLCVPFDGTSRVEDASDINQQRIFLRRPGAVLLHAFV